MPEVKRELIHQKFPFRKSYHSVLQTINDLKESLRSISNSLVIYKTCPNWLLATRSVWKLNIYGKNNFIIKPEDFIYCQNNKLRWKYPKWPLYIRHGPDTSILLLPCPYSSPSTLRCRPGNPLPSLLLPGSGEAGPTLPRVTILQRQSPGKGPVCSRRWGGVHRSPPTAGSSTDCPAETWREPDATWEARPILPCFAIHFRQGRKVAFFFFPSG